MAEGIWDWQDEPCSRELPTAAARRQWREARQFQVRAQKVLAKLGVHFAQSGLLS